MSLVMLTVLDGWGYSEQNEYNAIAKANTPNWDSLIKNNPNTLISASGHDVGLPEKQMGNSEVGHLTIGAGRVFKQDLARITDELNNNYLEKINLQNDFKNKKVHVVGLLSPGGIHSHENHIEQILRFLSEHKIEFVLHAILDGRDTPPQSAKASIDKFTDLFEELGTGCFGSISGRYYAMDRDKRWERTKLAFDAIVHNQSEYKYVNPEDALNEAYSRGETDEFVKPSCIGDEKINNDEIVFFVNFRTDRARQFCLAISDDTFSDFETNKPSVQLFTLTKYAENIKAKVIFEKENVKDSIGEVVANAGLTQLRIAETEKYAHVTFFFNGGREEVFLNEDRILVPSPKVETYDKAPAMSAVEVTDKLIEAILSDKYNMIICNYANADMVGHTGNMDAAIEAVNVLDKCLGRLIEAVKKVSGEMLITADHGNVELMYNEKSKQPHTAHTTQLVPFVYLGNKNKTFKKEGSLSDIAPTLLELLDLPKPNLMTGNSLFG